MFFKTNTAIDADTIRAYEETEYRVIKGQHAFTLKIGECCEPLAFHYKVQEVPQCTFVTAYNPYSQQLTDEQNEQRQQLLLAAITRRGLYYFKGEGKHPSNQWPGEPSYLVFGLNKEAAKKLGRQFEQNAIVWVGRDSMPQLILLR